MSNKKRKHKNATASDDIDAANQSQESPSMRETLNDFAYFQDVWDKSIAQSTTKKRKSNKQNNMMMDIDDDDDISTTSSLQSSHFSTSSDGSSIQPKKKRRKANMSKHDDTSITNAKDIHNKKEEDTKTSKYNTKQSKKRKVRRTHGQHVNSYQTLYHNMSIAQVDQLVGWAHSHSDNTNNHNCNTIDGNNGSEVERGIVELTHSSTAPPPPPSHHIAYLQHQISDRLESGNSSVTTEDTSERRRDRRSEDINIRDVDTSTYSTISKHNHNNMDTSTYIAIGMAIEERLTKSLMPLARAHVERCRRLELERDTSSVSGGIDLGSNSANTNESTQNPKRLVSDPFHAWTLPAAEAVAELARHGYATSNAVSELLGISQSKETSSKDSSSSESSTSSSSDDS